MLRGAEAPRWTQGAEASRRTHDGSGGSGGRMEKPIARAVTFFVSRIQIKHKKIHLALGHTWHSVILGTRSTWHSVILGTRSHLALSHTWHSVNLALGHLALSPNILISCYSQKRVLFGLYHIDGSKMLVIFLSEIHKRWKPCPVKMPPFTK